jgi:tight adherence protein B
MAFWIIPGAVFLGVMALVIALGFVMRDRETDRTMADRLQTFVGAKTTEGELPSLLREPIEQEDADSVLGDETPSITGLKRLIVQADVHMTSTQFLLASGALAVAGAIAMVLLKTSPLLAPLGAGAGIVPLFYLVMRRQGRMKAFGAQLPDALELMGRALRAGHSLASGFQLVSQEMPSPIAKEFQRTYEEQNFGVPLDEALKALTERIPNVDLRFFVTAVLVQRQTGGDLAEILDKLSYIIRERFKLFGQVQALTAEGRLSGWILNALPFAVLVALLKLNPSYVRLLFNDPLGIKMLTVAGVMQVMGAIAIRKIVNIRV